MVLAALVAVFRLHLLRTVSNEATEENEQRPISSMLFISSHLLNLRLVFRRKESPEFEDKLKKVMSVSTSSSCRVFSSLLVNHPLFEDELWLTETTPLFS